MGHFSSKYHWGSKSLGHYWSRYYYVATFIRIWRAITREEVQGPPRFSGLCQTNVQIYSKHSKEGKLKVKGYAIIAILCILCDGIVQALVIGLDSFRIR